MSAFAVESLQQEVGDHETHDAIVQALPGWWNLRCTCANKLKQTRLCIAGRCFIGMFWHRHGWVIYSEGSWHVSDIILVRLQRYCTDYTDYMHKTDFTDHMLLDWLYWSYFYNRNNDQYNKNNKNNAHVYCCRDYTDCTVSKIKQSIISIIRNKVLSVYSIFRLYWLYFKYFINNFITILIIFFETWL